MIIDTSYFLNKSVFIPNSIAQPSIGSNTPSAVNQLTEEIEQREYEVLIMALGESQTSELLSQFETNGDLKTTALPKWKELVEGKVYNGKKWNGLRFTRGTKKISLIAFYTFFHYLGQDYSHYSTTGVQIPEAENSNWQSPNRKQAKAWNEFVNMFCGDANGSGANYSFFQNWCGYGMRWVSSNENTDVSLYRFLSDHPGSYDVSFFQQQSFVNSWGL